MVFLTPPKVHHSLSCRTKRAPSSRPFLQTGKSAPSTRRSSRLWSHTINRCWVSARRTLSISSSSPRTSWKCSKSSPSSRSLASIQPKVSQELSATSDSVRMLFTSIRKAFQLTSTSSCATKSNLLHLHRLTTVLDPFSASFFSFYPPPLLNIFFPLSLFSLKNNVL